MATDEQIERQQIEWVFGLTGGELSDKPLETTTPHSYDENDFFPATYHYWYDGTPDYAARECGARDAGDSDFRTCITWGGGYLPNPDNLQRDADGTEWELVNTFSNSGETECPDRSEDINRVYLKHCQSGAIRPEHTIECNSRYPDEDCDCGADSAKKPECVLCQAPLGSPHGYISIGEGYEAVYRRLHRWSVIVGNIGTVYDGTDESEARKTFAEYVKDSKTGVGRSGNESVTLFCDDEITDEHEGTAEAD